MWLPLTIIAISMIESEPSRPVQLDEKYLKRIHSLNLQASAHNWQSVLSMATWRHLSKLNIKSCGIDGNGLNFLREKKFDNLRHLVLDGNTLGPKGIKFFTKIGYRRLEHLSLNDCGLGGEGTRHLTKAHHPQLRYLNLNSNNINGPDINFLIDGFNKNMSELVLLDCSGRYRAKGNKMQPIMLMHWVTFEGQSFRLQFSVGSARMGQGINQQLNSVFRA